MPPYSPSTADAIGVAFSVDDCTLVINQEGRVLYSAQPTQNIFGIQSGDFFHLPGLNGSVHQFTHITVAVTHAKKPAQSLTVTLRIAPSTWQEAPAYWIEIEQPAGKRRSKQRYQEMMEQHNNLVLRFLPDATITFINPAACQFFGKPREALLGASLWSLIPESFQQTTRCQISELIAKPRLTVTERLFITVGGKLRWVQVTDQPLTDPQGAVVEFQSIGRDIQERKAIEDSMHQSEMRLRELLENAHTMTIMLGLDGTVQFANEFLLNKIGYAKEEIIGQNWFELALPAEEAERVRRGFVQMAATGQVIPYAQNNIRLRDGSLRTVGWNIILLRDNHGKPISVAALGEDITERSSDQKIQEVTYRISQGANTASSLDALYQFIHRTLAEVMPVKNFFIALYDEHTDELSFPYFVDEYDPQPPPTREKHSLTAYVLQTGKPLLASPNGFDDLMKTGEVKSVGTPSVDWVGVPLKVGTHPIGVMVVQSYTEGVRFSERHLQILDFVSTQVALAIDRKRTDQALRENEEKYRALVEACSEAVFLETMDGHVLDCNNAACDMFGYTKEELLQTSVYDLLPAEDAQHIPEVLRMEQENGGGHWEMRNRRKDGSVFPVAVSTRLMNIAGQQLSVVYVSDITARKRREREVDAMAGVSAALRTAVTLADILPVILDQLIDRLNVHGAFITLYNLQTGVISIEMGCGAWKGLDQRIMPNNCPLCNYVIHKGQMYLNNCVQEDHSFPFPELIDGVKAIASVPLVTQGAILGALTVGYEQPIHQEDLHILTVISDIAASAIHRARLYEQTSEQAAELTEAYDATIEGWALALELRDKETQGHSRRVTELTLKLAAKMGLPETELVHIRRGVLLHDIGKMGIPDSILLKPGPLTEEEWIIMRKHPEYAYKMLASIRYLQPALDIPLCHHERWDGQGYPRQLHGEEIPLSARIFAVADVLDALTSSRPYRPAWSKAEALDHIRKQSGRHFDPQVVETFLSLDL